MLFHRKKSSPEGTATEKKSSKRSHAKRDEPIAPIDLAEIGIDELIKDNLNSAAAQLEVIDEERLSLALEDFVEKELREAFDGTVDKVISSQHKKLVQRGSENHNNADGEEHKVITSAAVREICNAQSEKKKQDAAKQLENEKIGSKRKVESVRKPAKAHNLDDDEEDNDDDYEDDGEKKETTVRAKSQSSSRTAKQAPAKSGNRPTREAAKLASSKLVYTLSDDDLDDSDENHQKRDESDEEIKATTKSKAKGRATTTASTRDTSSKRKTSSVPAKTTARGKVIPKLYDDDESDMDDDVKVVGFGKGWGTANTQTQANKRERR